MKKNFPVTQKNIPLQADQVLISGTDLKGAMTYCNDEFVKVSGFSRDELIGHNHNVVRHPDVPPAVYADLWSSLKRGDSWMGIVKNRAKNGDHYWVDAYITPIMDQGRVVGYESVRHPASAAQIKRAELLYGRLNDGKSALTFAERFSPLWWPVIFTFITGVLGMLIRELVPSHALAWGLNILVILLSSAGVYYLIKKPLNASLGQARKVFHNPLASFMYQGRVNAFTDMATSVYALKSRARAVVQRLSSSARVVSREALDSQALVKDVCTGIGHQQHQATELATAMAQMAESIADVARHARESADVTVSVDQQARDSRKVLDQTIGTIQNLNQSVQNTAEVVSRLATQSNEIGSFVSAIHGIADQTNLLALNAAIEAARAGEQGRGFAVVADEVRSLAIRTQEATEQIQEIISALQNESENAVAAISRSREGTEASVSQVQNAGDALSRISDGMTDIHRRTEQIATAAEQQSTVAGTINDNVSVITRAAENMQQQANLTADSVERVREQAGQQSQLAERLS
ncbi:methyl-accepting chemotaxis protein [Pokkaliibacter sp. CJK22405]|uniref:methyl-accepting chemotaxis protein n=1 Tax=Pokkaliibacter sp. CJK22405 TaxID=3384615 RepID=UPI003985308A